MRDYFKYKYGYVNIDSDSIYLTNTGNWSEINGMKEKGAQKQKRLKKTGIYVFLFISIVALLLLIINNINSGKISLLLSIGFPVGLYFAYKYLSTELGSQFKLPISKITNIEIDANTIYLTFLNYRKEFSTHQIEGATTKGLKLMTDIKDSIRQ